MFQIHYNATKSSQNMYKGTKNVNVPRFMFPT